MRRDDPINSTVIIIKMLKFIHAADIHLDSPLHRLDAYEGAPVTELRQATRRAFENLVQAAISNRVDFMLIAGDLFDGDWKDFNTGLYFVNQMQQLSEAGIPVYIVAGNHDAAGRLTRSLRFPQNVHFFSHQKPETMTVEGVQAAIHGQSYPTPSIFKDLSEAYPMPRPDCFNIGLLHTCLTGQSGHEPYAPCTLDGLKGKGYQYWALGHVHTHDIVMTEPCVVFPGNIQGRHIRECGPKGCVMVTVDDNDHASVEFLELDVIRWHVMEVNVSEIQSGYDLVDRFSEALETLIRKDQAHPLVARVIFKGETSTHDRIVGQAEQWITEIRSAALTTGAGQAWIEKIIFDLQPPPAETQTEKTHGALAELLRLIGELESDDTRLPALAASLQELDKKLPRELKTGADAIDFSDTQYLHGILNHVRPFLTSMLTNWKISEKNAE